MKVIVTKDYHEMSKVASEIVSQVVLDNPHAVLGLATGSSPIGLYNNLIEMYEQGTLSFANVSTVNLDEYVGLNKDHPQSYAYFMRNILFDHIDIDLNNTHIPCGSAENLDEQCKQYSELLKNLRQDIQVLGIGSNGHIGFNEPNTPFDSQTHVVQLAESTIKDNSRLFNSIDEVPTQAITMGIANIMNARKIIVVANGANKADAVQKMVEGQVSESCPASVLQRHSDVVLVCDELAAAKLQLQK